MKLLPTAIEGVILAETNLSSDHRGAFSRLFCERELASVLGERRIVQINQSLTVAVGTVRGMHYQHPPHAEMKLVRCIKGEFWMLLLICVQSRRLFCNGMPRNCHRKTRVC